MPEPNTVTAPREPEPQDESTAGWVEPPAAPEPPPEAVDAPTVTRTVASTPGPQHPERRTDSDDTERLRADTEVELPQIPGFLVQAEIGRGGMGVVYQAVHLEMAKTVALKVVYTLGRDPEIVRGRFAREVQALARLEHPNVVPIYHAGQWHGFPYFTMKFVPGGPLSHHLGRFHENPAACARLVSKVARAVQELHDHKVIHRDLKPLNILLGDSDEPLVADFGLAKWIDDDTERGFDAEYPLSGTGVPMGTRQYMAPEQTRGERTEFPEAADIWALGVTLYELLAGARPFPDDGRSDLAQRIREEPAPPLPDSVPAELAAVVGHCLAKRPRDRYASAAAVADDLESWLAGKPLPVVRTPRRRRGWLVGMGLLALLALIAIPAAVIPRGETRREPPSIPDRIRAGETVTLIGAKGLPKVLDMPGGRVGHIAAGPDGLCAVGTSDVAILELVTEAEMPPFIFEAEVASLSGTNLARFGIYTGRQSWVRPDGLHQAFFGLKVNGPPDKKWREDLPPPGRGELEAIYVRPTAPFLSAANFAGIYSFMPPPYVLNGPPNWYPLRLRVTPGDVQGSVFGNDLEPMPNVTAAERLQGQVDAALPNAPRLAPFGGGSGLFVCNGKALFRNVRLRPAN